MTDGPVPALELLHSRQEKQGFLTEADIAEVAPVTGTSPVELYGAVTAYPRFRFERGNGAPAACGGPACRLSGAGSAQQTMAGANATHCLGLCDQPVAVLTSDGPQIAGPGEPASLRRPNASTPTIDVRQSVFFGDDDPIETARDALHRSPDDLISAVTEAGLRGRGGAGFPTGRKWSVVRGAPGDHKIVVCNADESEPGTFKDRAILDCEPRRLLAGMVLAAHAVGATSGVIYIRYEYRPQYDRLLQEIERLRSDGVLGDGFDIVVRRGAGSYVCGEETALLNSLEGRRPIPRDRPPYPTTHGLLGAPTLVQNVETLAAIPAIASRGAPWFQELGSPKLYCVSGDVSSPGVFELPMTATAQELLEHAGATVDGTGAFTLGGLSGGLLPASKLDVRLDFEDPRRYDAFLGSGGVIAVGKGRCAVRFAAEAMRFFADESCGRCFPCRIGTIRLRERLDAAVALEEVDKTEIRDVIDILTTGSACGLGPAAGLVARHLLADFTDEYQAHGQGRCPAGECERS